MSFSSELFTDNTASAMTQTANEKTPTFEEAMAELEALVRKMEEGKLALEESVEAYTRGTELVICAGLSSKMPRLAFANWKLKTTARAIRRLCNREVLL